MAKASRIRSAGLPASAATTSGGVAEETTDAALVHRALSGDSWAEDALYRRHARMVIGLVTRLLGGHADVDDIVQDVFLSAFEQLPRLREPAACAGWLRQIAIQKVRRVIRRRSLQRVLGLIPPRADAGLDALAAPTIAPELRLELRCLEGALQKLPSQLRMIWMLRHVEGLTYDELAAACGCSRASVARRLADAQRRLQQYGVASRIAYWGEV
jgi:RNA polymerase sigma-70 factor, ECF subfamily